MYIIIYLFIAYAAGVLSWEWGFAGYAMAAVAAVCAIDSVRNRRFLFDVTLMLVFVLSLANCNYNSKSALVQYINKDEVKFTAQVKSRKSGGSQDAYTSYDAKILSVNNKQLSSPENTIIYVKGSSDYVAGALLEGSGSAAESMYGKNRLLFNYKSYLRGRGIHAVIFAGDCQATGGRPGLYAVREAFRNCAENIFIPRMDSINSGIVLSMMLGDKSYLDDDVYSDVKEVGMAHVFAVSGLHIGILYGALLKLLQVLGFSRRKSWVIAWTVLWIYGICIGLPVSVFRTLVMFTALFGSEVLYRRYNSINSIAFAGLLLLVINPFWLFDTGFQLSFLSALGLILYSRYVSPHINVKNAVLTTVYMYVFLQIFTLPAVAYYFNYIPVAGIIYNLVLIPVFTAILVAGFAFLIIGALVGGIPLVILSMYDVLISALRAVLGLNIFAEYGGFSIASPDIAICGICYAVMAYVIFSINYKHMPTACVGAVVLTAAIAFMNVIIPLSDASLRFSIADAGQGLFTLMTHKNMKLIFDCGSTSGNNFGEYTALPYVKKLGISKIDGLFISHWDEDHCSGVEALKENIDVKYLFAPEINYDIMYGTEILKAGDVISPFAYMTIDVLWPPAGYVSEGRNNGSLVIRVTFDGVRILLVGDIEAEAERMIDAGQADILIVPHHGSKSSSTEQFVGEVRPAYAVLSYGRNNYGIPSAEVVNRYDSAGSCLLSTYDDGEINFVIKDNEIYYSCYSGRQSENYYRLGLEWIAPELALGFLLIVWIKFCADKLKGEVDI